MPFQSPLSNADHRFCHQSEDSGLHAKEGGGHKWEVSGGHVNPGQQEHHQCARHDKERACDNAASNAVEQPTDISGELLSFRAGQQHAVI